MPQKNYNIHHKLISNWIKSSKNVITRKLYSSKELHELFRMEIDKECIIASKTFTLYLNKLTQENDSKYRFEKKEIVPRKYRYILSSANDNRSFLNNIKRCQRHHKIPAKMLASYDDGSDMQLSNKTDKTLYQASLQAKRQSQRQAESQVKCRANNHTERPPLQAKHQSQNQDESQAQAKHQSQHQAKSQVEHQTSNSQKISKMQKSRFITAILFFMGKKRAESIQIEEKTKGMMSNAKSIDYSEILTQHLQTQAKKLRNAFVSCHGWKVILDSNENVDHLSPTVIFCLRMKCYYLYKLYKYSIKYYNTIHNFYNIASLALLEANKSLDIYDDCIGEKDFETILLISHPETILRWFRQYRENNCFINPGKHKSTTKTLPPFLAENPDVVQSINSFCKENLSTISVETVHHHILDTVIPKLVKKIARERSQDDYCKEIMFSKYKLKTLTNSTTFSWMTKLGFNYHPRKKCYYVDSHESPENVAYCKEFISRYFEYKIRAYRWYSITKEERDKLVSSGELEESIGYHYTDKNNKQMVEYHVDDNILFQTRCDDLPYGGNLSVRKPPATKPLMIIGQDECIFKQYLFTAGYWMMPDGTKQLVPKDEGNGIMLSSFTCRELGYGCPISDDVLEAVNLLREGKKYSDQDAAKSRLGKAVKGKLTSTPFVC